MKIPRGPNEWNSTNLRFYHWHASWLQYKNNWLWGVGTGDASDAISQSYIEMNMVPPPTNNSHNQYLQVALTLGLFGLIILILGLLIPAVLAMENGAFLYAAFLGLFAIIFCTESLMEQHKGIMFYALFNSLLAFSHLGQELYTRRTWLSKFMAD